MEETNETFKDMTEFFSWVSKHMYKGGKIITRIYHDTNKKEVYLTWKGIEETK